MASLPITIALEIQQGDTWSKSLLWTIDGVPVDFSEVEGAKMQFRPYYGSGKVLAELSLDNGGIELPEPGRIVLKISAALTAAMPAGKGVQDCEIYFAGGVTRKPFRGSFDVAPEVTK